MPYLGIDERDFKKRKQFSKKSKMPKFRTKISLSGYIQVRLFKSPIFSFLKSAPSTLSNQNNFAKIQKCLNLGPKSFYLGFFELEY